MAINQEVCARVVPDSAKFIERPSNPVAVGRLRIAFDPPKKQISKKSKPFVQSCGQEMSDYVDLSRQQSPQSVGSPTEETDSGFGPADDVPCSVTFQGTGGGYLTVGRTGTLGISQVSRSNSSSSQTDGASQAQPCDFLRYEVTDLPPSEGGGEVIALRSQLYQQYYIMGNTDSFTVKGNVPRHGSGGGDKDKRTWWRPVQYKTVFPDGPERFEESIVLQYWGDESRQTVAPVYFCIEVEGTSWSFRLMNSVNAKLYGAFDWHDV